MIEDFVVKDSPNQVLNFILSSGGIHIAILVGSDYIPLFPCFQICKVNRLQILDTETNVIMSAMFRSSIFKIHHLQNPSHLL